MRLFFGLLVLFHMCAETCRGEAILLWHGMGDSCDGSMNSIIDIIEQNVWNARVHCVGGGVLGSFFGNVSDQIESVCNDLWEREDFRGGYVGIGFSQGGLFMRALAQKCRVPMKQLISIGGPQMGVVSLPSCAVPPASMYCKAMNYIIEWIGFFSLSQKSIVQAQYLYLPGDPIKSSPFLKDITGGRDVQCQEYARRMTQMERLVLFRFTNDTMVEPPESSHFGVFNGSSIVPLGEQEDVSQCLGLDTLMASNRLEFRFIHGQHMQFSLEWFQKHVVETYLAHLQPF
jgi:palmitoyl-protein thioesterase